MSKQATYICDDAAGVISAMKTQLENLDVLRAPPAVVRAHSEQRRLSVRRVIAFRRLRYELMWFTDRRQGCGLYLQVRNMVMFPQYPGRLCTGASDQPFEAQCKMCMEQAMEFLRLSYGEQLREMKSDYAYF